MTEQTEAGRFNAAMDKLLKADPAKVKAQMERERQERANQRLAKRESTKGDK